MYIRRLLAITIAVIMVSGLFPISALGSGETYAAGRADNTEGSRETETAPETGALPETADPSAETVRIETEDDILAFSRGLGEMIADYGPRSEELDLNDPYSSARLIVLGGTEPDLSGSVAYLSGYGDWRVIQYASPADAAKAEELLLKTPGVRAVSPDEPVSIPEDELYPESVGEYPDRAFGNHLSWGYGADYIDADNYMSWLLEQYGGDESALPEVTVAVIDTGVNFSHVLFDGRLVQGYDFYSNDDDPSDENGHGSHVAGTVVDGTFGNVKIMPLRTLNKNGQGYTSSGLLAIQYAYEHGCRVANMSFGSSCSGVSTYESVINQATDAGMVCVAGAGNDHDDAAFFQPACVERALTVANHTAGLVLASSSNYGAVVDVSAPGTSITSAYIGGSAVLVSLSGTSMATPHASAACALVLSRYPDMDADSVMAAVKISARDVGIENGGTGVLDLTDLFVYDPFLAGADHDLHFFSDSDHPWTVSADGVAESGNASMAGTSSSLSASGVFGAYEEVSFEYRLTDLGAGDRFVLSVNGVDLFTRLGDNDWQTAVVTIPENGKKLLTWTLVNSSGGAGEAQIRNVERHRTVSTVISGDGFIPMYFGNTAGAPWIVQGNAAVSGDTSSAEGLVSEISATVELTKNSTIRFAYMGILGAGGEFTFAANGDTLIDMTVSNEEYTEYGFTAPTTGTYTLTFRYTGTGFASVKYAPGGAAAAEYDEYQAGKLREFLELTDDNGVKNGEKVSQLYNPQNPASWNVVWQLYNNQYYRVKEIRWSSKALVGAADFSRFSQMTYLQINYSGITSIKIGGCGSLQTVLLNHNALTSVDLGSEPAFPELETFDLSWNQLSGELDLPSSLSLKTLSLNVNALTGLRIDGCPLLASVNCSNNSLASLELVDCPSITSVNCSNNSLASLEIVDCPSIASVNCSNNSFVSLDLGDLPSVTSLDCSNNAIASLDLSGDTNLYSLSLDDNPLVSADLSGCAALPEFSYVFHYQLSSLDLSGCSSLTAVKCWNERLASLDLSGCTALETLDCSNNMLSCLDLGGLSALTSLDCRGNSISELGLSGCSALETVYFNNNALTSLDLGGLSALTYLNCENNALTELGLSGCSALETVYCQDNALTSLDLGGMSALTYLNCKNNALIELGLSGCSALESIDCSYNAIASLDLGGMSALEFLNFEHNSLTELDLSGCSALETVYCQNNALTSLLLDGCTSLIHLQAYQSHLIHVDLHDLPRVNAGVICVEGGGTFGLSINNNSSSIFLTTNTEPGSSFKGWYRNGESVSTTSSGFNYTSEGPDAALTAVFTNGQLAPTSITVAPVSVYVGTRVPVNFSCEPLTANYGSVRFEVLNTNVASVETGEGLGYIDGFGWAYRYYVRGLAAGTTTIIARSTLDNSVFGYATVTVMDPIPTGIAVEPLSVYAGNSAAVSYTILPEEISFARVTFSVADPSIATVDQNGTVTGVSGGVTTLTVASLVDPSVFGTAEITVTEQTPTVILVDDVTVEADWFANTSFTVLPDSTFNKAVTYEIADTDIAEVDENGVITGVSEGVTTLTVRSVSDPTVFGAAEVTVVENLGNYAIFEISSETVLTGGSVSVDVSLRGDYSINALTCEVFFRSGYSSPYSLSQIVHGPVWDEIESLGGSVVSSTTYRSVQFAAIVPSEALTSGGVLFTMVFNVDSEATAVGDFPITATVYECKSSPVGGEETSVRTAVKSGILTVEFDNFALGDVNGDGEVNATDALLALRQAIGIISLNAKQRRAADVNHDGTVNASDALIIMRVCLGLLTI